MKRSTSPGKSHRRSTTPHTGSNIQVVIAKLLTERPTSLRVLRDTVPEGIDAAVARALAKLPADRYTSAGEFARALATPRGSLPHARASFSISNDGRHVAMFNFIDKNDVYMIRNFGQMLRR